ncbi:MAG: carboxypeptidase regulatory-like domain-containing protein, partial [Bryobacteraceae bacterium]
MQVRSVAISLWLLLLPMVASAQSVSGRISGTIVDTQDASITGAEVSLVNEATGERQTRQSNESGIFLFPSLPPGTYTIRASRAGFTPRERKGIALSANGSVSLGSVALAVGGVTERIDVETSGTLIELDNSGQSQVVTSAQMKTLMAAGRDVMALMKVLPGVSQQSFGQNNSIGGSISGAETNNFSGTRAKWNSVKLDGQPGQNLDQMNRFSVPIAWDAVEEVTVQPNSYLAEHGRSSGVHINVISKSGTNEFHGSGYLFRRHEQFNASNYFNNRDGLARPIGRFTSFGASAGGPIRKDKLFFFASQEWWRVTQAAPIQRTTLPTDLEKAGNFSQTVEQNGRSIVITDPTSRMAVPGNIIPANRLDKHGLAMLAVMPAPNSPATFLSQGFNNIMQQRIEIPKSQTQFKVDWLPTSRDRISFRPRWFGQDLRGQTGVCCSVNANFAIQPHHYNFLNRAQAVTWTRTVSASLVNELSGGWFTSRERGDLQGQFDLSKYKRESNGLGDLPQLFPEANASGLIPGMQFAGVPNSPSLTYDDRTPIAARDDRLNLQNQISWLKGTHNVKAGFFYELQFASEGPRIGSSADLGGRFLFNRDANNPLDTNHPFSNAAFGVFREYRQASRYSNGAARMYLAEWFAQDSWKATRHLSLDFGVRFSRFTDYRLRNPDGAALDLGRYDRANAARLFEPALNGNVRVARNPVTGAFAPAPYIGAYVPGAGNRINGIVAGGVPELKNGFRGNPPLQVQPRFGFAYDLAGKGNTVIRGGIGIYKQAIFSSGEGIISSSVVTAPPIVESPNLFFGTIPG